MCVNVDVWFEIIVCVGKVDTLGKQSLVKP